MSPRNLISTRRLTRPLALLVSVCALFAALAGASQTLAQTRGKAACSTSSAHANRHRSRACVTRAEKTRHKHHRKHKHGKRGTRTTGRKGGFGSQGTLPARCEDGSTPSLASDGSYACEDGSQPECENGATPTPGANQSLLCPAFVEQEPGAGESSCEELEEEEAGCADEPDAQACEAAVAACEQQA